MSLNKLIASGKAPRFTRFTTPTNSPKALISGPYSQFQGQFDTKTSGTRLALYKPESGPRAFEGERLKNTNLFISMGVTVIGFLLLGLLIFGQQSTNSNLNGEPSAKKTAAAELGLIKPTPKKAVQEKPEAENIKTIDRTPSDNLTSSKNRKKKSSKKNSSSKVKYALNGARTSLRQSALKMKASPLVVGASVTTESNAYSIDSDDYEGRTTFSISPSYKFDNNIVVGAKLGVIQIHNDRTQTQIDHSEVFVTTSPYKMTRDLSFTPSIKGIIATNYEEADYYSYQGTASLGGALTHKTRIFGSAIDMTYGAKFSRNFHKFSRSRADTANIMHSASGTVGVTKTFAEKLSFGLSGTGITAETYQGSGRSSFILGEEISYVLNKKTSTTLSVGHYNWADAYKPNGRDSNVAVFDEKTSTIYGSVSHSF